ncbi:MAG: hypothetical protein ACRDF9_11170 [Candidatus Limnocylindria bacterium]
MDPGSLRPPMFSLVALLSIAPAFLSSQDSVQVNDVSMGQQDRPDVAMSADSAAYLIWDDYRSGGNGDIFFSLRDPVTGTWSANERVNDDNTGRTQWSAAIAVDGSGVAYAVWQDQRDGKKTPDTNIYFAKRDGGTWSANSRINDDSRAAAHQATPRIAVTTAGDAVAVWGDHRSRQWNVYSSRLSAGGALWAANLPVTDNGTSRKFDPDITIGPDGTAYAVWDDDRAGNSDVWFSKLLPGALSWTPNERISDDPGTAAQYAPRIDANANGDLFVLWLDDRVWNTEVRMTRLTAGGANWETSRVVSDTAAVPVTLALGIASEGAAFAVWQDARGASYDIWGAEYDAASDTWLAPTLISDDPAVTAQMRPTVARTSSQIVAAWRDDRVTGGDIRARVGESGGQ